MKSRAIRRREILELAGKAGLASAGAILLGNCKGPTTPEPPPPPPPPVEVDVLIKFYNHTQGYLGEKTYTGMSDSPLEVRVSDCPDTSTVDPNRIAIRKAANGGFLGKHIGRSNTGQLTTVKYPRENTEYDAFLMNMVNGADYNLIDNYPSPLVGYLCHRPDATWWREDVGCSGPDEIPREAMKQIKEALVFPWAKYMDFTEVPMAPYYPSGDFWVGYCCPSDYGTTWRGFFHSHAAWVNPIVCQTEGHPLIRVF